jgi:alpha-2-macroglobulin
VVENLGDAYAPLLDSEGRTTAMVLRALIAIDHQHPLASRLARGLLASREHGQWRSTQEAAWALLALDDYRKVSEAEVPSFDARVWIGADLALDAPFRGRSARARGVTVPIAKVFAQPGAPLSFQVDGTGDLFYEAKLSYARRDLPSDPIDRGISVRKLVRAVSADGLADALATVPAQTQTHVPLGGLVLVDLVVMTTTPRLQVVVDDPLPAGLEPVDSTLATTAASISVDSGDSDEGADGADGNNADAVASGTAWGSSESHREMRDDRVLTFVDSMAAGMYRYRYLARATTAGVFVVPPTKAECMYEPAVFGRTAGSRLEVSP